MSDHCIAMQRNGKNSLAIAKYQWEKNKALYPIPLSAFGAITGLVRMAGQAGSLEEVQEIMRNATEVIDWVSSSRTQGSITADGKPVLDIQFGNDRRA